MKWFTFEIQLQSGRTREVHVLAKDNWEAWDKATARYPDARAVRPVAPRDGTFAPEATGTAA